MDNPFMMEETSRPRLIWYQLVESATGQPYKAATVSSVSLPSDVVIDLFRKAVKSDNPNKLSSFDASDLVVYKNKAAFDRRNADEENEKPLKSSEPLHALGTTEEKALFVAVPQSPVVTALDVSHKVCDIPFYKNISRASVSDEWLMFTEPITDIELKNLYIRKSYESIATSIFKRDGKIKVIITGTPGIGKSLFLVYLLHKLVTKGKRVLFIYDTDNIYYDENGGIFRFGNGHLPSDLDDSFWNRNLWCLFDAKYKSESDLGKRPYGRCNIVLSTSPRRDLVNDFKKSGSLQVFYMPVWSEDELTHIAPLYPQATDWRDRFQILGGIARTVMEATHLNPTRILENACRCCSFDDCIRMIGLESALTEHSNALIHMTSIDPYIESSVCYASKAALDVIVKEKELHDRHKMRNLLTSCESNPLTAALRGYIFESYALEVLEKGGDFRCRKLVHGNTNENNIPGETTLTLPQSMDKVVVEKVADGQKHQQFYVPVTKNYPAIDAWIPGIGAFQITIGKEHDLNKAVVVDLANLGEGGNKLYWVLPPCSYDSFKQQRPRNVDQYALKIPYPKESEE